MKYVNAADVLPQELLEEVSRYVGGRLLYVPAINKRCAWGEKNGSKQYYQERNQKIKDMYRHGKMSKNCQVFFVYPVKPLEKL